MYIITSTTGAVYTMSHVSLLGLEHVLCRANGVSQVIPLASITRIIQRTPDGDIELPTDL